MPPVLTRTWFHTGVYLDRDARLAATSPREYYREPGLSDAQARALLLAGHRAARRPDPDEEREACRALKGSMLRQEVYALDGTAKAPHPYTVTEQNFTIRAAAAAGRATATPSSSRTPARRSATTTSASPPIPRIGHALTLEVDDFGNVLKSAAVGYGRRHADPALTPADQARADGDAASPTPSTAYTNAVDAADDYRTPLPCRDAHLRADRPRRRHPGAVRFTFDDLLRRPRDGHRDPLRAGADAGDDARSG